MMETDRSLTALVFAHGDAPRLASCLASLAFADEQIVVLSDGMDAARETARRMGARLIEGAWAGEGERRSAGVAQCRGAWVFEVDAHEAVTPNLAVEICAKIALPDGGIFAVPIRRTIGGRWVRHGWGGCFGLCDDKRLFLKGEKTWGSARVRPTHTIAVKEGSPLGAPLIRHVSDGVSGLLKRLDKHSTARALDLADQDEAGRYADAKRAVVPEFLKTYFLRGAFREGRIGMVLAVCDALFPVISHLKAVYEHGGEATP